jgi:hypothetical protein
VKKLTCLKVQINAKFSSPNVFYTRLGEFSYIGRLFILGGFLEITEVTQIFLATFSTVHTSYVLILTKKWVM